MKLSFWVKSESRCYISVGRLTSYIHYISMIDCQSRWGSLFTWSPFFPHCDSCPRIPSLFTLPVHPVCQWHLGTTISPSPTFICSLQHTHWDFFNNTLQLRLVPPQMQHKLTYSPGSVQIVPCVISRGFPAKSNMIIALIVSLIYKQTTRNPIIKPLSTILIGMAPRAFDSA